MNRMRLSAVNFIRKNWSKSFKNWIIYKRVCLYCLRTTNLRQNTPLLYKHFTRATETRRSIRDYNFENILAINVPKCHRGKVFVCWQKKLSNSSDFYCLELGLYPCSADIVEAKKILIQEKHSHSESVITVKVSRRTQKVEIFVQYKAVLHWRGTIRMTFSPLLNCCFETWKLS